MDVVVDALCSPVLVVHVLGRQRSKPGDCPGAHYHVQTQRHLQRFPLRRQVRDGHWEKLSRQPEACPVIIGEDNSKNLLGTG